MRKKDKNSVLKILPITVRMQKSFLICLMNSEFTIPGEEILRIYGLNVRIRWEVGNFSTTFLKMQELWVLQERASANVAKTISE